MSTRDQDYLEGSYKTARNNLPSFVNNEEQKFYDALSH
jgi:hypothetical protein